MNPPDPKQAPAFPTPYTVRDGDCFSTEHAAGMTLRDYFAGQELAKVGEATVYANPEDYGRVATHCYRMADAMLAARGRA